MTPNITYYLSEFIKEEFNVEKQHEIAKILGVTQPNLNMYIKKNNAGPNVIKKMLQNLCSSSATNKNLTSVNGFQI